MTPHEEAIARLREVAAKATPRPWFRKDTPKDAGGWPTCQAIASTAASSGNKVYAQPKGGTFPSADADLIVSAANYAVALATELRQARELLVRSRKLIRDSQKVAEHYNDVPSVQEHRALIEAIDAATGKDGAK